MKMSKIVKSRKIDTDLIREIIEEFKVPYLIMGDTTTRESEVERAKITFFSKIAIMIEKAFKKIKDD